MKGNRNGANKIDGTVRAKDIALTGGLCLYRDKPGLLEYILRLSAYSFAKVGGGIII
ncbi:MAG: hypothetical protein P4M11_10100 [Candidatus Pacebacteria bacterium]|nr:hypothetical protein [Candidatus Paceibacterota bacterium]